MTITSIRYNISTPRKKPRAGDRRTTKKHGLQVRVHQRSGGMLVMGGGHRYYLFEWVSLADAVSRGDGYLLTDDEKRAIAGPKIVDAILKSAETAGCTVVTR